MQLLRKSTPRAPGAHLLDWQLCEDEHEWDEAQHQAQARLAAGRAAPWWANPTVRRWRMPFLLTLLLVAVVSGWRAWQQAQAGLAQVATEVKSEVVAELARDAAPRALTASDLAIDLDKSGSSESVTGVEVINLGQDWAAVEVTLQPAPEGPSYRQTRVYRESGSGWQQLTPAEAQAHWGVERVRESEFFVIHYRTLDEAAVAGALPRIDALYPHLLIYASMPMPIENKPVESKPILVVDPALPPGAKYHDQAAGAPLVVASPAALLIPDNLSSGDVLLQAWALALFNKIDMEAIHTPVPSHWFRLHDALRLWLVWKHDLPLAKWRDPLLEWVLEGAGKPVLRPIDHYHVPPAARELCLHHALWMRTPLDLAVPVACWQRSDGKQMQAAWRYREPLERVTLTMLIYPITVGADPHEQHVNVSMPEPGPGAILLATVFEYVEATYGPGRMPLLLAAIPEHQRAETLIPAVFGVPSEVFTEEWHAFLAERY